MFLVILELLNVGLQLWLSKEKTKYIDKKLQLEKEFYAEWNKPESERSDAVLDNLSFELKILAIAFTKEAAVNNKSNGEEVK